MADECKCFFCDVIRREIPKTLARNTETVQLGLNIEDAKFPTPIYRMVRQTTVYYGYSVMIRELN